MPPARRRPSRGTNKRLDEATNRYKTNAAYEITDTRTKKNRDTRTALELSVKNLLGFIIV